MTNGETCVVCLCMR